MKEKNKMKENTKYLLAFSLWVCMQKINSTDKQSNSVNEATCCNARH